MKMRRETCNLQMTPSSLTLKRSKGLTVWLAELTVDEWEDWCPPPPHLCCGELGRANVIAFLYGLGSLHVPTWRSQCCPSTRFSPSSASG